MLITHFACLDTCPAHVCEKDFSCASHENKVRSTYNDDLQ